MDVALLVIYMVSMYFTVRFSSPAVDEQQAQQQKIMAFMSPAMIGFFGWKQAWPSALYLYWLTFNICSLVQQFILLRRYPRTPPAAAQAALPEKKTNAGVVRAAAKKSSPAKANSPAARKKRAR
jgi:YidC/Oxa1 family membrane protein insertase